MPEPPSEWSSVTSQDEVANLPRKSLLKALGVQLESLPKQTRAALEAMADEILSLRQERTVLRTNLANAEMLADRDTLCPVFNRRAFERELVREIALAERYGTPLCLLYVDLDRFKLINDRFGHATGDQIIQLVARALLDSVRQTDIVGRLGGDEFAIALTHADLTDSIPKAQSLERVIDNLVVRDAARPELESVHLGASFGTVEWQAGMTKDQLIGLADETMFREKARRRRAR